MLPVSTCTSGCWTSAEGVGRRCRRRRPECASFGTGVADSLVNLPGSVSTNCSPLGSKISRLSSTMLGRGRLCAVDARTSVAVTSEGTGAALAINATSGSLRVGSAATGGLLCASATIAERAGWAGNGPGSATGAGAGVCMAGSGCCGSEMRAGASGTSAVDSRARSA